MIDNSLRKILRPIIVSAILIFSNTHICALEFDYVLERLNPLAPPDRVPIPLSYSFEREIRDMGDAGDLNEPEDLFIDSRGILYVADTGNSRVVKMTREGDVLAVYYGPENMPMNNPQGVFVDKDGDLYVADTGNFRVLHLSSVLSRRNRFQTSRRGTLRL